MKSVNDWGWFSLIPIRLPRLMSLNRYSLISSRPRDYRFTKRVADDGTQSALSVIKSDWKPTSQGRVIMRPKDADVRRSLEGGTVARMMPQFMRAVFGTSSDLVRLLMQSLDPGHKRECREIFAGFPEPAKVVMTNEEDFGSLFALGVNAHTQRHRDSGDL
ncbi:hypothetical protein PG991_002209 [Apiospora marii]|uniref:Uncharacterized protein n=1 Tax=Apiospora marii TaxID=335849 RepID=A0ABR1SG14_9PEZI